MNNLWLEKFKDVFVKKTSLITEIFDIDNFGLQNGLTIEQYLDLEKKEFEFYQNNHGNFQEDVKIINFTDNLYYFYIKNNSHLAIYESVFMWNNSKNLAYGNQYPFKIESKLQFVKKIDKEIITRKINVRVQNSHEKILKIRRKSLGEDLSLNFLKWDYIFAGDFYSFEFDRINDNYHSYVEEFIIYTDRNKYKCFIYMKGVDHPLFKICYSKIKNNKVFFENKPQILNVQLFDESDSVNLNYVDSEEIIFDKKIVKVCATDMLGFDWISYE